MKEKFVALLAVAAMLALPTFGLGATVTPSPQTVNSNAIIKADGTSGQVLTTGNGIKTGHIQNKAITNAKLFGNISGSKLAPGAVNTAQLKDGAVTDLKISGLISAAKINSVGLNADTVDGKHAVDFAAIVHAHSQSDVTGLVASLAAKADASALSAKADVSALTGKSDINHDHDTLYRKKYANVIVVAKSGGDTASISEAAATANSAAEKPVIVKVMPGNYEVSEIITLNPGVTLEGSGELETILTSSINCPITTVGGNVKQLTLRTAGPDTSAVCSNGGERTNATLSNVTLVAGGSNSTAVTHNGPWGGNALVIKDSTISATALGIYAWWESSVDISNTTVGAGAGGIMVGGISYLNMTNVRVSVSGPDAYAVQPHSNTSGNWTNVTLESPSIGLLNSGHFAATINMVNASITAPAPVKNQWDGKVIVSGSKLAGGPVVVEGGIVNCFGVYDGNYQFYQASCP